MAEAFFDGALVLDWSESVGHSCKLNLAIGIRIRCHACERGEDAELSSLMWAIGYLPSVTLR